ncbi:MAG: o-succinylbenzoate synthase [Anaerolineae bacterium]
MTGVTIERIELRLISMELVSPFQTSFGVELERPCIIISVHGEGLTGWGECVAAQGIPEPGSENWAFYSYETTETAWHILNDFLVPVLVGRRVESAAEVVALGERLRGHPMARAGLEAAVWDLLAQAQGLPLADLLAGNGRYATKRRDRANVGVSIGIQPSIEATIQAVDGYVAEGYGRIKLKIKPGWDVEMVRAVRREFPDILLMVDANSAYTLEDAASLKQLDEFNLLMIEQPLAYDDIYEHSLLQAQLETAVCLDESIHTPKQAEWSYEINACRIINIKPGRVGGLWAGREIHDLSLARDKPVWCGGMLETGIGRAANVALASLPNFTLPSDISASDRYYRKDIVDPPFVLNPDSTLSVPENVGLGVRVNQERLAAVTYRQSVIAAKTLK